MASQNRVASVDVTALTLEQWQLFATLAAAEGTTATGVMNKYALSYVDPKIAEQETKTFLLNLSENKRKLFDSKLKKALIHLEAEFEARVQAEIKRRLDEYVLPSLNKKQADADKIVKARKGVMTRQEYRKILACLHPDSVPDPERKSRYIEAFQIFEPLELAVCSEKELPTKSSTLPQTTGEMMAMRKTRR